MRLTGAAATVFILAVVFAVVTAGQTRATRAVQVDLTDPAVTVELLRLMP